MCLCAKSLQSCPILCDTMDSSVHGILQAKMLEWVAMPSSRGSSQLRESNLHLLYLLNWQANSLPLMSSAKVTMDENIVGVQR